MAKKNNNNAAQVFRDRIAIEVYNYCDLNGISDRKLRDQITEQTIQLLESKYKNASSKTTLPGWDLQSTEIQSAIEQIRSKDNVKVTQIDKDQAPVKAEERTAQATQVTKVQAPHKTEGEKAQVTQIIKKQEPDKDEETKILTKSTESPQQEEHRDSSAITSRKLKKVNSQPTIFSENAMRVLEKRYLKTDDQGKAIETPYDMFRRVAHNIASAELAYGSQEDAAYWEEQFYRLMTNLEFLPNSPTLMNAGRELQQLSACFVLPINDSMEGIFDAIKYTALIHKSGGGTGFSFSRLRPEGDTVGSTGKVASGPISFMKVFDAATDAIKQGGMRRGANMAILSVNHPDIEKFITAKEKENTLTNFNLSVAATDKFMKAAEDGEDYDLINPKDGSVSGKLNAKNIFDKIVELSWRTGDPGLIFIDRMNADNPTPSLGKIESTNPCGEQPLLPYESCNLGSINLARMVNDEKKSVDYDKLRETVKIAVRFLDNVIDKNKFPLPEIEAMTKKTRKIGLGIMGFADLLIKLDIPYDSEKALTMAEKVMGSLQKYATDESIELAKIRGVFPAFEESVYKGNQKKGVRNATRTTIAPTGTLSIIANCSSGIEPLFALSYIRNILDGDALPEVNPYFDEIARKEAFYSEKLMKELASKGSLHGIDGIPSEIAKIFVTAHDIKPEWHIKMQAAFQRSTNNAVSKTINFPQNATKDDIAKAYVMAYKEKCKGITIYRDKSKEKQVLNVPGNGTEEKFKRLEPRKRAAETTGFTRRVATGCGHIYVTVNSDEHGICEVFSTLGKAGGCASAQLESTCRLISLALRSGIDASAIVKHIRGIRCPSIAWEQGHSILSCPDAIASVLGNRIGLDSDKTAIDSIPKKLINEVNSTPTVNMGGQCPDCGGLLVYQEGCQICHSCGYTKCS